MPNGFSKTEIVEIDVSVAHPPTAPLVIDDYTLSKVLKYRTKMLWYFILNRDSLYKTWRIPKAHKKTRIIHEPQKQMKIALRNLNRRLLNPLQEPLGEHVAAYRKAHSIKMAVAQHVRPCPVCDALPAGQSPKKHDCPKYGTFIKIDLKDFFHSTKKSWVRKCFRHLGYSHYVSDLIANLTTINLGRDGERRKDGVPQGSPASGAVCNLVANDRLDPAIQAFLAGQNAAENLTAPWEWRYTRYSDDLIITCGKLLPKAHRVAIVKGLKNAIRDCGYRVNPKKVKAPHSYFRKRILGVVINRKINLPKEEYRKMRALVHNCKKHGFDSQYKKAGKKNAAHLVDYLQGKLGYMEFICPEKGGRLMAEFQEARMEWAA